MEPGGIQYADFGRRLLATLIDITLLVTLIITPLNYLFFSSNLEQVLLELYESEQYGLQELLINDLLPMVLVIFFWVRFRGTPGKRLLGCQVVDQRSGGNLSLSHAVIRYIGYIVSLLPLGLGFFWIMFDRRRQGFHDKLAGSVVIYQPLEWPQFGDESRKSLEQLMKEAE